MRGYIEGALWALVLGSTTASGVSYLDENAPQLVSQTAAVTEIAAPKVTEPEAPAAVEIPSDPPVVVTEIADSITAFAKASLPRLPQETRAPFVDKWVPVLTNSARRPELPLVDGDSAPEAAPNVEFVALEQQAAPDAEVVPLAQEPAPETEAAPAPIAVQAEADQPAPMPVPPAPAVDSTPEATDIAPAQQPESATTGVVINRLGIAPSEPAGETAEIIEEEVIDPDAPDLERYAAAFENPEDLPVLAIVLVDGGTISDPASAIASLGFAPTVVVNALNPDAQGQLAAYRAAGAEVAIELALPQGALPADVEVAFEAALGLLPETAMLYSSGGDVVQGDRQVTAQVIAVLAARGMGFVAEEQGLGSAVRTAGQSGVPSVAVARDLDANGESAGAIERALDQAAFRARQSGDVVLRARLDETTLAALRDWAAANADAGTVIGPVSGVLISGE